jgi:glycerol-3-phosphate acyltransferase PlsY
MVRKINFMVWGIYNLFDNGLLHSVAANHTLGEGKAATFIGLGFALCIILSYLAGSVNFALVVSRLFYHDDVRRHGSGNAGATNVLRNYGKKAGALTFIGDGLKGALSILVACLVFGCPSDDPYYIYLIAASYFSAFFCIFGHVFPCFSKFRGGKGFATMALSVLCLNPFIALILAAIFFPLVLMTKYVSLGSVVAALFYPVLLHTFDSMQFSEQVTSTYYGVSTLAALLIAALITWAHRGNIKRIMDHTERKLGEHSTPAAPVEEVVSTPDEDGDDDTYTPAASHGTVSIKKKKHPVSEKKLKRRKRGNQ